MPATKPSIARPSRSRESRDRLLARIAFEAVWDRDLETGVMSWEGNLESMFGYSRDEIVNQVGWWRERVHCEDIEQLEAVMADALQGNAEGWSNEYRFRRKDGSWAWVLSRCVIERDDAGRARHAIGAMIDISQLKDTEWRLRLFTEQIPARACITDRELRVVWDAGAAFPKNRSVVGKTVPELFAQSPDRERVLEGCRGALEGEWSRLEIDDGIAAAQLQLVPFRDSAGDVIGVVGIAFDITDRVRSEEQARSTQRLLQEVLEILPVGLVVLGSDGEILLHNAASQRIWAGMIVSAQDRLDRMKGFWHGSQQKIAPHEWASQRAIEKGETSRDELIDIVALDGTRKTIHNYAAPIHDANGKITGAVVVNDEVTERVRAEEALRQTEQLLTAAEKLGQTGSWEQDLVTGHIFHTDANRRLFFGDGRRAGNQIDDYVAAMHPDDRERVIANREQLHAGSGSGDIEFRVIWPDGSVHWIFARATIVRDADGRPVRAYGTNADITERKRAEEELERRARQLQELSARLLQSQDEERRRIARELHDTTAQNLAVLTMNLSRLMRSATLDASMREALGESLALAEASIEEIRTLSYLLHPPMIEEAGLLPALRWYTQGFEERSGIRMTLDLPRELERLPRNVETAIFRIVQEAMTNIQRHSGSGVATIRLKRNAGALWLIIEDQGRGLPPRLREEPPILGATGVGIVGIRERVRELGGTVQIESRDNGTLVHVTLPISG
ncbi:MAG: PAS domain-containing sensor histidine kinase [Thermoanaerobaculia bacterium]